ncbi:MULTISPECIES: hypothetical protein [Clavibacter]|uniref:Uncharacterized protein n=2 Tax=Clavibacter TaxID=1573 RepID=A0A399NXB1_9MICO|nr:MULTISPECIES: hypothetical protein [Clavibacter]KDP92595.1 hypothetical protein W824_01130 [Clavibacter cf. michiganensis LMG 26808]RII98019.1 hypothetical protein DZF96_04880 [Clavibacter michiganensis]UKF25277.1 hypothetical protein KYT88_00865 [Clavibacter sp. A6099]
MDTDDDRRLFLEHLRAGEPSFADARFTISSVVLEGRADGQPAVRWDLPRGSVTRAIAVLGPSGRGLWRHASPRTAAFRLLAIHMEEWISVPDTDPGADQERRFVLVDGHFDPVPPRS